MLLFAYKPKMISWLVVVFLLCLVMANELLIPGSILENIQKKMFWTRAAVISFFSCSKRLPYCLFVLFLICNAMHIFIILTALSPCECH